MGYGATDTNGVENVLLKDVAPFHVQRRLVVDTEARIYIASDHGESIDISKLNDVDEMQMFIDLAHMQKTSISKVNELQEAGVPMYKTGWIAEHLEELLDSKELLFMKEDGVLVKLKNNKEHIRKRLLELESLTDGLLMTTVHIDLASGNVFSVNSKCRRFGFFDWGLCFHWASSL